MNTTTNFDYEHCHNHYSVLSETDQPRYDSIQLAERPAPSNRDLIHVSSSDVTDDGSQSASILAGERSIQPITSQCRANLAPATVEDCLAILHDNAYATAQVYAQLGTI